LGWTFYNSSGQQLRNTGTVLATQAEMEAGSVLTSFVTPGRTQHHPGVVKASVRIAADGTIVSDDYNVASITDTGTGDRTIVWDVDFDNANYTVVSSDSGGDAKFVRHGSIADGSVQLTTVNAANSALVDSATATVAVGKQV